MESVNFGASGSGAELDRALMDLGPLLGVTIKEEAPDDGADPNSTSRNNGENSVTDGSGASAASGEAGKAEGGEGADSLASPAATAAAERCVLCSIPLTLAEGIPKLMECLHSACEPCLKAKIDEKMANNMQRDFLGAERITITCPVCRLPCAAANMIEQRFVMERMAAEQAGGGGGAPQQSDLHCSSCEDTEPATAYCVDCAEFICDNCVQAHQRLKITKDHTIKSKEEALTETQAAQGQRAPHLHCREHPQERLTLFCETCDRLTCRDCQLQHHRDHKYQFSTEMAAQARASIESLLSEVSYKRVLLASAMKVIRDRQQLIADKKKALVHDITQTVVKLTNAINSRGKQLVLRLNEVCDAKQRTLREKKDALEQLAAVTHHAATMVRAALDTGSDTALLATRGALARHLQRVKSRRADIPNPEIPVRIALAFDNLPELLRVVSSVGAIVVDGKVEGGGAGGAGGVGPYHPPGGGAPAPPHAAPAPPGPHNAVVALQHAAAMQSYVASGGGGSAGWVSPLQALAGAAGGAPGAAGQRARPPTTPLRHPHVTSTTHPHHLHGNHELNLRGLLTPAGAARPAPRPAPPPNMTHHQNNYHHYQQMMGAAYAAAAGASRQRGGPSPRTPSPAPPQPPHPPHPPQLYSPHLAQQHHAQAKWHIPQQAMHNGGMEQGALGSVGGSGADFKITLGRQHSGGGTPAPPRTPAGIAPNVVTSTNPKTPSPSLNGGCGAGGALELDAVCAESVQDLMATIAKLDSNGVQVVAEAESPHTPTVHSSTTTGAGAGVGAVEAVSGAVGGAHPDPNEDWCAVCMDGGELMCCDKCPKVFHQYCHIPTIEKLPEETETWQCLLCVNFAELELSGEARAQKVMERITLELYCQYDASLPFREPVPAENLHYHAKISVPMCLDTIRAKLQPRSPARYSHMAHFVADCRLLFKNAFSYNPPDSQIYKEAKRLEEFFEAQLVKLAPEYAATPPPAYWGPTGGGPAITAGPHSEHDEPANKRQRH